MDEKKLVDALIKDEVSKAIEHLGVEGAIEAIDKNIINPRQRGNMRRVYFSILKERGLK